MGADKQLASLTHGNEVNTQLLDLPSPWQPQPILEDSLGGSRENGNSSAGTSPRPCVGATARQQPDEDPKRNGEGRTRLVQGGGVFQWPRSVPLSVPVAGVSPPYP